MRKQVQLPADGQVVALRRPQRHRRYVRRPPHARARQARAHLHRRAKAGSETREQADMDMFRFVPHMIPATLDEAVAPVPRAPDLHPHVLYIVDRTEQYRASKR